MSSVLVIGSGSWGTALAQVLADNGHEVYIWGRNEEEMNDLKHHQNCRYFEDLILNKNILVASSIQKAKEVDIILMAVPSGAVDSVSTELNNILDKKTIIINVAKGFHPETLKLLSEVIEENIDINKRKAVVSLLGPSHAENVILRKHTAVNAVTDNEAIAEEIQELFSNDYFRVYRNPDVIGAQIGVAIKNIIAVASGIAEGLDLGDNARAALITRGLAEMTRFGVHFGGNEKTYLGLCGVGDLVVTASSHHSRNFQAGLQIGRDNTAKYFLEENTKTVEGIKAAKAVHEIAVREKISMPITEQVYEIVYLNKKPSVALNDLMNRELKKEFV